MRLLLKTFALLAVLPYLGLVLLIVTGTATWSSIGYVVAMGVLIGGLVTLPDADPSLSEELRNGAGAGGGAGDAADGSASRNRKRRRPRGLTRAGALGIVVVAAVRVLTAGSGNAMQVVRGGDRAGGAGDLASSRFVNRLLDEGDVATLGTRVLVSGGALSDDRDVLPTAMADAYAAMRREEGSHPTPFIGTYLGLQSKSDFDLVVFEPKARRADRGSGSGGGAHDGERAKSALVFLHGYAGNFDLPCWQMAHAVDDLDVVTACPSTRWIGDWWSPQGEAILRSTVATLHARGVERIVLAGLSNGGYGASKLAPRLKGSFAGVILLSGADPSADAPGVPSLVVHGNADSMAGYWEATSYAKKYDSRLVTLEAGHFAMLVRMEETNRAVHDFVRARLEGGARSAAGHAARR